MLWRTGYLCCVSCTVRQSGGLQSNASPPPPPLHPPALSGPPGLRQLPQWSVAVLRQLLHPQREGGWFVCSVCLSVCFLSCQFSLLILTVDLPQVCDGRPDCGDLSDEGELCQPRSGTVCPHFLFSCHNQQECVSQVQSPFLTSHLTPHTLHSLHLTHFSGDRLQWPTGLQ